MSNETEIELRNAFEARRKEPEHRAATDHILRLGGDLDETNELLRINGLPEVAPETWATVRRQERINDAAFREKYLRGEQAAVAELRQLDMLIATTRPDPTQLEE